MNEKYKSLADVFNLKCKEETVVLEALLLSDRN